MQDVAGWLREAATTERAIVLACLVGHIPMRFKQDALDAAERFDNRAAQVEAMGWRPIEEAPRNKTVVDLWESDTETRIPDCAWLCGAWHQYQHQEGWVEVTCGIITHFMPLPQPPVKR